MDGKAAKLKMKLFINLNVQCDYKEYSTVKSGFLEQSIMKFKLFELFAQYCQSFTHISSLIHLNECFDAFIY